MRIFPALYSGYPRMPVGVAVLTVGTDRWRYRDHMNSRHRELSKLYEATWTEVKSAVDAADPQGLLALGSPGDEYDDSVA